MHNFILLATLFLYSFNYCDGEASDPIFLSSTLANTNKQYRNGNEAQNGSSVRNTNKQAAAEEKFRNLLYRPAKGRNHEYLLQTLWEALTFEEFVSIFGHQKLTSGILSNSDIDFTKPKLVRLHQNHHNRKHGNDFERNQVPHQSSNILIYLAGFGLQFNLNVYPNKKLLDPNFVHLHRHENFNEIIEPRLAQKQLGCFYHGSASYQDYGGNDQEGEVALSLCGGMKGFILPTVGYGSHKTYYVIHPLPSRLLKVADREIDSSPCSINTQNVVYERHHIIFRRQGDPFPKLEPIISPSLIFTGEKGYTFNLHKERSKWDYGVYRNKLISSNGDLRSNVTVETAVFVDKDLFKLMQQNFPEDTQREVTKLVLAMINGIQLLYKNPSLGYRVHFVLKRLEVLELDPPNLVRRSDVDRLLANFCEWQKSENAGFDADPLHWDHALLITGLGLYTIESDGRSRQVVGLSHVNGMCTLCTSCTVIEGQNVEAVFTVAHEIGHNLGIRHDGPKGPNDCDTTSYIMSGTESSGKVSWSACSKKYLKQFLETEQAKCLFERTSPDILLDPGMDGKLPGEKLDANRQCKLSLGQEGFHATQQPLEDVCRKLHCRREYFIWTGLPALEGTKCSAGDDMWCRAGKCVPKSKLTSLPPSSTNLYDISDLGSNNSQNTVFSGCSRKVPGIQALAIIHFATFTLNVMNI